MGLKRKSEFHKDAARIALTNRLNRNQFADDFGAGMSTPNKWITTHQDTAEMTIIDYVI